MSGIRLGTAAIAVGLSLAGPHALGIATADEPEHSDPVAVSGGAAGLATPRGSSAQPGPRKRPAPQRRSVPAASATRTETIPAAAPQSRPQPSAAAEAVTAPSVALPSIATAAVATPVADAASTAASPACARCWGLGAPSVAQGIATAINHLFNTEFDWLAGFPANPITDIVEGALLLIRRTVFGFVPTGVSATQVGTALTISVNTGSVAYFRTQGNTIEVAGDPGFSGAYRFDAPTVTGVVATGAGTAGCAGFVFTAGTAAAALSTSGIDSLRFGSGAAFSGTVASALSTGVLDVADGVRGLAGVTLDAPVRVRRDTEIDAGSGDATFTGTVDGQGWFGGQSLTVTALGTTTFAGNVGGNSPLGQLITRGVVPLQIPQSTDSRSIPLYYTPIVTPGGVEVKYGIDVAIGDNAARRYLFDTGGNGFFAGYDPSYWTGVQLGTGSVDITYTSGQYLDGLATPTIVTIGTGSQTVSTGQPVDIAAVTQAGSPSGPIPITNTFFTNAFAGDFGTAFGVQAIDDAALPPYTPGTFITSPLFQLPGNLSSGYLVQLGPIGTTPQLTVGVTDALRAQFPYAVPITLVTENGASAGSYPISGYPLLEQFGFAPQYSVISPDPLDPVAVPLGTGPLPSLIDSGAASTNVRLPDLPHPFADEDGNLTPGATFVGQFPTADGVPPLTWQFVAGNNGSVDAVGYSDSTGAATDVPNVNTGLNLFNQFDVMYDVADQLIWLRPNGGQSTVTLRSVTTTGEQSYGQNAVLDGTYRTGGGAFAVAGVTTLQGSTVVDTGRGDVTFSGTVDAASTNQQWLRVNSRGTTTFVRAVGGLNPLSRLSTDAGGTTVTAAVSTGGAQSYGDDTTLNGDYLAGTGGFSVAGSATFTGATSVQTTDSPITFAGRVDSAAGQGWALTVSATDSAVHFNGAVGARNPLGGLVIDHTAAVTAGSAVNLDGSLPQSTAIGLSVGDGVGVTFTGGGTIANFTGSGVVFQGASAASRIQGFTIADNVYDGIQLAGKDYAGTLIASNIIYGNSAFGIETLQAADGLAIRDNTIGAQGSSNPWGYTTSGPNAQGIVLGPGNYTGTQITGNTIAYNRRSGIAAPAGVQGVLISGNTLRYNAGSGIDVAGGDFTGTQISANTISQNGSDGISLGAGLDQGVQSGGNPLDGYDGEGHYLLPYSNHPDFYDPTSVPPDPQVALSVAGGPALEVNLDTGSRGLYFDQYQIPNVSLDGGTPGYVYLNSSNRMFFGQWVNTEVTFTQSEYVGSDPDATPQAVSRVPVLVVTAVGASMTPPPGSTTPSTTFATTIASGTVTITNGTLTQQVPIVVNPVGSSEAGSVTIPGGWWANYQDNLDPSTGKPVLGPVANFGVGFDRTGFGTSPTDDGANQSYNAFLNLTAMRAGTMRAGYVLSSSGVQLGLDNSVRGYAYTDLAPTGLAQDGQSAPDWQPATGRVLYDNTTAAPGPLVIDIGIPTGILTLPGQSPSTVFTNPMTVDLLNSGGKITYTINTSDKDNLLSPTAVTFFEPLAGGYSQNMPPLSQQFFNTGRKVLAGLNYLYDATGGYLGLTVPANPSAEDAFDSAAGKFEAAYFADPLVPAGVTNIAIDGNVIDANGRNGVTVNGDGSTGNVITANSIFGNAGAGIALTRGGNGEQPTPVVSSATLSGSTIRVSGTAVGAGSYTGPFQVQVFSSPATDAPNVQGHRLLGVLNIATPDFQAEFPRGTTAIGDWITVIVTPAVGDPNTSEFSVAQVVR